MKPPFRVPAPWKCPGMFFAFTSFMAKENENGQERTEQPTSKRLQDAREKGQVCKSIEVSTALLFLVTVIAFYLYIPTVAKRLGSVVGSYLGNLSMWNGTSVSVVSIFRHGVVELGIMTLPLLVLFLIIGLASNIMQIGFMVSPEAVTPKLSKINPLTGFRNRFMSLKGLELLIKTLVIMTIIIWVSYRAIRREMPVYPLS